MPGTGTPDPKHTNGEPRKPNAGSSNVPMAALVFIWLPELPLGRIVATPAALEQIPAEEIRAALQRHRRRDWGTLDPEDRAANEQALIDGARILSCYQSKAGVTFWIITEADRSVTTVLLPEDY